jgi:hypothetical protein
MGKSNFELNLFAVLTDFGIFEVLTAVSMKMAVFWDVAP